MVPREKLNIVNIFKMELKNEMSQKKQTIICAIDLLSNENYNVFLETFPTGKEGDKFSFSLIEINSNKLVLMGKLMIVSENENIQDYSKKSNNKYYS
jgi:hypothetical protein